MAWPARHRDDKLRCPVAGDEPVVAVLPHDLESRPYKQQLQLRREVHVADEICNEALGQPALLESVVDQAHVGALQVWFVRRRGASQQSRLFSEVPATGIDIEIDEGARLYALGFGQRRQVRHADIKNKDAAWTQQAKRGRPRA